MSHGASPFAGAVLCGGRSRRMGRDKALIEIDGRALALRAALVLEASGASPVVCVGGDAGALRTRGLTAVDDEHPGDGPLGGIITALGATQADVTVVLACDLLRPDAGAIEATRAALAAAPGAMAAVPVVAGRLQWLHAAWRREVRGTLAAAHGAGERAIHAALAGVTIAEVHGLDEAALADADRPTELPPTDGG